MSKFFPAKFHTDENKMKKLLKKKNLAFEKLKKIQKFICLKKKKNLEEKKFNKICTSKKSKLKFLSMCQTLLTDIFSKVIKFFQECVCVCVTSAINSASSSAPTGMFSPLTALKSSYTLIASLTPLFWKNCDKHQQVMNHSNVFSFVG